MRQRSQTNKLEPEELEFLPHPAVWPDGWLVVPAVVPWWFAWWSLVVFWWSPGRPS